MIIALTGPAGSGKDTTADYLTNKYGFTKVAFATPLRAVCKAAFGLTDDEMSERDLKEKELSRWPFLSPRQILQEVGTDLFRERFPGVWLAAFTRAARPYGNVVVPDLRFADEAKLIQDLGGRIVRLKALGSPYQISRSDHISEAGVGSLPYDIELINDFQMMVGMKDLFSSLDELMSLLAIKRCSHCNSDWVPDAIR